MSDSLQPLFRPDRLAVIGASARPEKKGFQILRNILEAGFAGQVIPVPGNCLNSRIAGTLAGVYR